MMQSIRLGGATGNGLCLDVQLGASTWCQIPNHQGESSSRSI